MSSPLPPGPKGNEDAVAWGRFLACGCVFFFFVLMVPVGIAYCAWRAANCLWQEADKASAAWAKS